MDTVLMLVLTGPALACALYVVGTGVLMRANFYALLLRNMHYYGSYASWSAVRRDTLGLYVSMLGFAPLLWWMAIVLGIWLENKRLACPCGKKQPPPPLVAFATRGRAVARYHAVRAQYVDAQLVALEQALRPGPGDATRGRPND